MIGNLNLPVVVLLQVLELLSRSADFVCESYFVNQEMDMNIKMRGISPPKFARL